jgi:hypothetical protein
MDRRIPPLSRTLTGLLALLGGAALFLQSPLAAQDASITGRIISARSGEPIEGAEVDLLDSPHRAVTSGSGLFRMSEIPAGQHTVRISYMGAESRNLTVDLSPREAFDVALQLEMKVLPVPELVVTVNNRIPVGKLYEFERRAQNSPGYFITREEIEERHASRTTDILRRVPGLEVGGPRIGRSSVQVRRRAVGRRCTPDTYVDGAYAPYFDPDNLQPSDIAGIEVYRGNSEVPPEYRRADHCGVIVFWTRDPSNWRGFQ